MSNETETAIALKDYLPLVGVIIGGVLATVGGFASNMFIDKRQRLNDAKNLAFAFKGELSALSTIYRKRGYLEAIKSMISRMEQTGKPIFVQIDVRREYFHVFKNNVDKIGILESPLPEKISVFYVQANSILEDLQSYKEGIWKTASVESVISSKKELVGLMEDTFSLADEIVATIDEMYS